MDIKIGSLTLSVFLIVFWINLCCGIPNKHSTKSTNRESSIVERKSVKNSISPSPIYSSTTTPRIPSVLASVNGIGTGTSKPHITSRNKRDALNSRSSPPSISFPGIPDFQTLLTSVSNGDNEGVQNWMRLWTPTNTMLDQFEDDEDDSPAIELVHGKKPGTMRYGGMDSKDSLGPASPWTADEPIVLHQHRLIKKASTPTIPGWVLRQAASGSRTQPDPSPLIRNFLARFTNNRKQQRADDEINNNGRVINVGHLLEHSSRINDGIPAVHRLVL